MKGKSLGLLALTLLLSNNQQQIGTVSAYKLSEQQLAWNSIDAHVHSHSNLHSHHKKKKQQKQKKKHQKKSKKKQEEEESESESEDSDDDEKDGKQDSPKKSEDAMVQHHEDTDESVEAQQISQKASTGLNSLQAEDASLQDMYQFSKVIANGKTAAEALKEEKDKLTKMQEIAQKENEQRQEQVQQISQVEKEEEAQRQIAVDITTRKMLAKQYENMMIEDEKRESADGGGGMQVLADQQAEQNYAINVYKGSGEMSKMLDSMEKDAVKKQKEDEAQALEQSILNQKLEENTPSAEAGEKAIQKDDNAIAIFSSLLAKQVQLDADETQQK